MVKPNYNESFEFPYKLILKYGETKLLDGDVIHASGITPSGIRENEYIGDVAAVEGSGSERGAA